MHCMADGFVIYRVQQTEFLARLSKHLEVNLQPKIFKLPNGDSNCSFLRSCFFIAFIARGVPHEPLASLTTRNETKKIFFDCSQK